MSSERLRLAVAQITSTDQTDDNLKMIEDLYRQAAHASADLIVFPENSLFFRIRASSGLTGLDWEGSELKELEKLVNAHQTALMLTTPLKEKGEKLGNTTIFFVPGKSPERIYRKIHLFDVDVVGAPPVRESDFFNGGHEPRLLEFRGWKLGLSICYDLRFSELYSRYAQRADLILVPAAFLVPTGEAHWHVLLRARAIESQCYVAAPAQSGEHRSGGEVRRTFGHSLVVDPWGGILMELTSSPEIRVVDLMREPLAKTRRQIPMESHRRLKPV